MMTVAFTITPVERGIMRCRHTGEFTHETVQSLADFFHSYGGKLLVDLTGSSGEECSKYMKLFRPMMPTTAIFGAEINPAVLELPDSYYTREVRYFKSEEEALAWLREQ